MDGVEQIILAVAAPQAAAVALYRSLGFVSFGREPRALKIGDSYVDEEYMILRLGGTADPSSARLTPPSATAALDASCAAQLKWCPDTNHARRSRSRMDLLLDDPIVLSLRELALCITTSPRALANG